jgi:hypothetical protein
MGFRWSDETGSGLHAIMWRDEWEYAHTLALRGKLIDYNLDDCSALEVVAVAATNCAVGKNGDDDTAESRDVVSVESLKAREIWPKFKSPINELEEISRAARWDYQRDRIYVRASKRIRRIATSRSKPTQQPHRVVKIINYHDREYCPRCGDKGYGHERFETRVLHNIHFGRFGLRRKIVGCRYRIFWCSKCRKQFGKPEDFWSDSKYGRDLVAYIIYHVIELYTPTTILEKSMNRLLGLDMTTSKIFMLKARAVSFFEETHKQILKKLTTGGLLHVDETRVSVKGKTGYVWVLTNLHEVAYIYSDTREGSFVKPLLQEFHGVLISDFYAVYDSFDGPQQKCLLHLIRDLNAEILNLPYDEELKTMVREFAILLRTIVVTIDQRGLKRHFMNKHMLAVEQFFRRMDATRCQSEAATKCKQRFIKNRDKLFTFLAHDCVPWNNNNAEHAIKAFARLRDILRGSCTPKAVQSYLVLLSVCQTCKYMGVDFLDFLRSGEKDIHAFAQCHRIRRPAGSGMQKVTSPFATSQEQSAVIGASSPILAKAVPDGEALKA